LFFVPILLLVANINMFILLKFSYYSIPRLKIYPPELEIQILIQLPLFEMDTLNSPLLIMLQELPPIWLAIAFYCNPYTNLSRSVDRFRSGHQLSGCQSMSVEVTQSVSHLSGYLLRAIFCILICLISCGLESNVLFLWITWT